MFAAEQHVEAIFDGFCVASQCLWPFGVSHFWQALHATWQLLLLSCCLCSCSSFGFFHIPDCCGFGQDANLEHRWVPILPGAAGTTSGVCCVLVKPLVSLPASLSKGSGSE